MSLTAVAGTRCMSLLSSSPNLGSHCDSKSIDACMKENNEKKMENCDEISKLIKAFPKDIAALDKRSVLAKVNSQGSGR